MSLVDSGPLHATIMASKEGHPLSEVALQGGEYALKVLEEVASFLPVVKKKSSTLPADNSSYPRVVAEMISASKIVNDPDFTPLAAVAGTTADIVADHLMQSGASKIVVNNGGDIAIRLKGGEKVKVGLRLSLATSRLRYAITVEKDCGICTSGLGGRSFTLGIADSVIAMATRASVADASATYLGNSTSIESPSVKRELAESIYPETDIPGKMVTTSVGALTDDEIQAALQKGKESARALIDRGIIQGALIAIKGEVLSLGSFEDNLQLL